MKTCFDGHTPGPWTWADDDKLEAKGCVGAPSVRDIREWGDQGDYKVPATVNIVQTDSGCYGPRGQDAELIAAAPALLRVACELAEALEDRDGGVHDQLCVLMMARAGRMCGCGHEEAETALAHFHALVDPAVVISPDASKSSAPRPGDSG